MFTVRDAIRGAGMSLNGFFGGALGAFGPSPLSQQRGDPLAQLLGQYQPGARIPINSQADLQNAYHAQLAQASQAWRIYGNRIVDSPLRGIAVTPGALRDYLDHAPSVDEWIPLEERWKREAEAEVLALCPILADPLEPIIPDGWWLRFLRWLRDIIPVPRETCPNNTLR